MFFVADVDDRVDMINPGSAFCTLSESSQGKLIQERPTQFGPIHCNGVCLFVVFMMEADSSGPSVRMRKPEAGPHGLVILVFQVKKFNS